MKGKPDLFVEYPDDVPFGLLVDAIWEHCADQMDSGRCPSVWMAMLALDPADSSVTSERSSLRTAVGVRVATERGTNSSEVLREHLLRTAGILSVASDGSCSYVPSCAA
jgi:hypothetical protein